MDRLGHRGNPRDNVGETLFQSAGGRCEQIWYGQYVYSLTLSIHHFLCRPRRRPPSKVTRKMVLERLALRVSYPNHVSEDMMETT